MILYELDNKIKEYFNEILETPKKIKEVIDTAPLYILMYLIIWFDHALRVINFLEIHSEKSTIMNQYKLEAIKRMKRELKKLSK